MHTMKRKRHVTLLTIVSAAYSIKSARAGYSTASANGNSGGTNAVVTNVKSKSSSGSVNRNCDDDVDNSSNGTFDPSDGFRLSFRRGPRVDDNNSYLDPRLQLHTPAMNEQNQNQQQHAQIDNLSLPSSPGTCTYAPRKVGGSGVSRHPIRQRTENEIEIEQEIEDKRRRNESENKSSKNNSATFGTFDNTQPGTGAGTSSDLNSQQNEIGGDSPSVVNPDEDINKETADANANNNSSDDTPSLSTSLAPSTFSTRVSSNIQSIQRRKKKNNNSKTNNNHIKFRMPSLRDQVDKRVDRGRVTFDFRSRSGNDWNWNWETQGDNLSPSSMPGEAPTEQLNTKMRVAVDPNAIGRLIPIFLFGARSFVFAFVGTLRMLPPLVVSKRILVSLWNVLGDWYAGRYLRKTYSRLEKLYIHYYETPATFRALSRTLSQWLVYQGLARIMGYVIGNTHQPCRSEGRGLAFICGLLWIGSVVGLGHAFATGVALWGGPLRLQATAHHPLTTNVLHLFVRPWRVLRWMQNPEKWMSMIAKPEKTPFDPNPLIFPATWLPLRLLQMVGVAKVAATEPCNYLWCSQDEDQIPVLMSKYLLQLALCDEWYRVFVKEKRVGLGICVAGLYYLAMINLLVTSAMINGPATVLMIPSLIAIIVSGWMNVVIFWNREQGRRVRTKGMQTPLF